MWLALNLANYTALAVHLQAHSKSVDYLTIVFIYSAHFAYGLGIYCFHIGRSSVCDVLLSPSSGTILKIC